MLYKLARLAILLWVAAGISGCGSGFVAQGGTGVFVPAARAAPTTRLRLAKGSSLASQPLRSWMAPDAKKQDLMYISDSFASTVYVYSYPAGKLVGELTGLSGPQGMCADAKGNIWVTSSLTNQIMEFAHGGTSPLVTLMQTGQIFDGCSVDPSTGALAVSSFCQLAGSDCISVGSLFVY